MANEAASVAAEEAPPPASEPALPDPPQLAKPDSAQKALKEPAKTPVASMDANKGESSWACSVEVVEIFFFFFCNTEFDREGVHKQKTPQYVTQYEESIIWASDRQFLALHSTLYIVQMAASLLDFIWMPHFGGVLYTVTQFIFLSHMQRFYITNKSCFLSKVTLTLAVLALKWIVGSLGSGTQC